MVECPLRMRKVPGSNPGSSRIFLKKILLAEDGPECSEMPAVMLSPVLNICDFINSRVKVPFKHEPKIDKS